jgi:hypothetical protein
VPFDVARRIISGMKISAAGEKSSQGEKPSVGALSIFSANAPSHLDPHTTPARTSRRPFTPFPQDVNATLRIAGLLQHLDTHLSDSLYRCVEGDLPCNRTHLCAICCRSKEFRLIKQYREYLLGMANPSLITLTTYPVRFLDRTQILWPCRSLAQLRRRAQFSRAIKGGIACLEVCAGTQGWLVHLHLLADCTKSFSKNRLKTSWQAIGGGQQLDVQSIKPGTIPRTFSYGLKFQLKKKVVPDDVELLRQYLRATWGVRLVRPWGSVYVAYRNRLRGKKP